MQAVVHFDLKGAPLKIDYFKKVLLAAKSWGATGVLLEWEDTFPYYGHLEIIGSQAKGIGEDMYTVHEVQHILTFCREISLEPIQLVQTIGHMEYVLKHAKFEGLREVAESPAVLCPTNIESKSLLYKMIYQVLTMQPAAKYVHLGADEVWYDGVCERCQDRIATTDVKSLYLEHMQDLVMYTKNLQPHVIVLIWDDMVRKIPAQVLHEYHVGWLFHPVVWNYDPAGAFHIPPEMWELYNSLFKRVWGASAFKGANGISEITCEVSRYVSNTEAWVAEMRKYRGQVKFSGLILTGWSRYYHGASLCELMPVALPSLASCLKIFLLSESMPKEDLVTENLPPCNWPGNQLADLIRNFAILKNKAMNPNARFKTDTSAALVPSPHASGEGSFSIYDANDMGRSLYRLRDDIQAQLYTVMSRKNAQEWLMTHLDPLGMMLMEIVKPQAGSSSH